MNKVWSQVTRSRDYIRKLANEVGTSSFLGILEIICWFLFAQVFACLLLANLPNCFSFTENTHSLNSYLFTSFYNPPFSPMRSKRGLHCFPFLYFILTTICGWSKVTQHTSMGIWTWVSQNSIWHSNHYTVLAFNTSKTSALQFFSSFKTYPLLRREQRLEVGKSYQTLRNCLLSARATDANVSVSCFIYFKTQL